MKRFASKLMISVIRLYQNIAPSWIRNSCRYTPTCSQYAIMIINEKGPLKGFFLSLSRILRCFPPFGGNDWPNQEQKGDSNVIDNLPRM
ncbi:MAG: membrane protein insertion efficiency factor YidD [Planctomycetota bacterium]|nr:MAG: membrane protein insertion efficiency factor YidD [Planctomycetota bacterium]